MKYLNMKNISPILNQLDLANSLTIFGLILSLFSTIFSIQQQFNAALICMIFAGVVDLFDGFVARRIKRTDLQAETGKQLDSIVDVCSFGFSPVIFAYCYGLNEFFHSIVLIIYIAATSLRLAYFNCKGLSTEGSEQYFTGMPVTYAALFIPLIFIANFILPVSTMKIVLTSLYIVLSIAMLGNFKILKLQGIWYGFFSLGAVALTAIYIWVI